MLETRVGNISIERGDYTPWRLRKLLRRLQRRRSKSLPFAASGGGERSPPFLLGGEARQNEALHRVGHSVLVVPGKHLEAQGAEFGIRVPHHASLARGQEH